MLEAKLLVIQLTYIIFESYKMTRFSTKDQGNFLTNILNILNKHGI